jgi:uncharacterized membrane protein (DUF106 family)
MNSLILGKFIYNFYFQIIEMEDLRKIISSLQKQREDNELENKTIELNQIRNQNNSLIKENLDLKKNIE